ncbi:MAG: DegV family protein [Ilumatobacteraceae bacterium]
MISIVTDSASMLPEALRVRYDIAVVPITIGLDGDDYREGVDLTTDDFYRRLGEGATATTAAPAPGVFTQTYRAAAAAGATRIVSVHTGSAYSATVGSATLASRLVDIPVDIVDTGVASFPVALAVWAAAEAIADGRPIEDAIRTAADTASAAGSLFVVGVPEVARSGGRLTIKGNLTALTVLELARGNLTVHSEAPDLEAAITAMVERVHVLADSQTMRVGVGHALRADLAAEVVHRLSELGNAAELVTYEIGPSVGAHTGPGTIGVVYAPIDPDPTR